MQEKIEMALKHISEINAGIESDALALISSNFASGEFLEKELIKKLTKKEIDGSVAAIDSGMLMHRTHGLDLMMIRTIAVNMVYSKNELAHTEYFPVKIPLQEIEINVAAEEGESMLWRTLVRLKKEINIALSAIEHFAPCAVLLDGSVAPLPNDRPSNDSELLPQYKSLIEDYKKLYTACRDKKIQLIGIIKDSRGRRFADICKPLLKSRCNDSMLLNHLLKENERTSAMRYSTEPSPALKELGGFANSIYLSYMKMNKNDLPLRVEFLNFDGGFEKEMATAYALSAIGEVHAYPAALTEADLRVAMGEREFAMLNQLFMETRALRRNSRPFR